MAPTMVTAANATVHRTRLLPGTVLGAAAGVGIGCPRGLPPLTLGPRGGCAAIVAIMLAEPTGTPLDRCRCSLSCPSRSVPIFPPAGLAFASLLGGPFGASYCITTAAQSAAPTAAAAASTARARSAVERVGTRDGSGPEAQHGRSRVRESRKWMIDGKRRWIGLFVYDGSDWRCWARAGWSGR